jgi:hypothetical protein
MDEKNFRKNDDIKMHWSTLGKEDRLSQRPSRFSTSGSTVRYVAGDWPYEYKVDEVATAYLTSYYLGMPPSAAEEPQPAEKTWNVVGRPLAGVFTQTQRGSAAVVVAYRLRSREEAFNVLTTALSTGQFYALYIKEFAGKSEEEK